MSNIRNNMSYAIVKKTKKLSILLILVMMFLSIFNISITAEDDSKPDLIVSGLVVHGHIVERDEITIEATIKNQEDVTISKNIQIALILDGNWLDPVAFANLPNGLSGDSTESVDITWTAESGVHQFSVFVDYPDVIIEVDENNNVWDFCLNVTERDTDLKFINDEITIDAEQLRVGIPVTVSAIATNTGKNTTDEITAGLYIDDSKKNEIIINGLSTDATHPLSFEWSPERFGNYNVSIKLDYEDSIAEQDEDNNDVWDTVFVDITNLEWWDNNWHYRKFYELSGTGNISVELNFTDLLDELDVVGKPFESDNITIVKYTTEGTDVVGNYSFNESEDFNSVSNALGNLTWTVDKSLYYCIYFDVTENTGNRIGIAENPDLNTSGTSPAIVFEASVEGWWCTQEGTFRDYYTPSYRASDQMEIKINTKALAKAVVAEFYLGEDFSHTVYLTYDDLNWSGVSSFSDIGNWTVEICANDTAGYQPEKLTHDFYVGLPDFTVTNITFSSNLPGSPLFYEGYTIYMDADVTVYNTTVYGVTVSLEIDGVEMYTKPDLTIIKDQNNPVRFTHQFHQSKTYEITAKINPDFPINESNVSNNNFTKTLNISGIPDLGVVNISVPTKYYNEGDRIEIFTNVKNNDKENVTDYQVNLYTDISDNNMSYDNERNHTFVSLKKNETKNISLIWDSAKPGEWDVGIKILKNESKPDSNIFNNSKAYYACLIVNATKKPENNDPVVEILQPDPLDEFERNSPVEIIAKITDESGIKNASITITDPKNTTYTAAMTKKENDKYSYTFEKTSFLKIYNFTITAFDNSEYENNATKTSNFTIVEDATPPEIKYVSVLPYVQLKGEEVTIRCTILDPSGVKYVQINITCPDGSSETKNITDQSDDGKYYYTQSYELLGKYVFYIATEDMLGNGMDTKDEKVEFWITTNIEDTDSDGMPDWWEEKYGFNPYDPADAAEDEDDDGYTNVEEYEEGTDPLKPLSLLQRIMLKSRDNWLYVIVSVTLFIVVIALSIYGIRRRKT